MARFTGALEPGELIAVQHVFKRVTQHLSFEDNGAKLDWLGRLIINAYQGGITDSDNLYRHCLAAASAVTDAPFEFRFV